MSPWIPALSSTGALAVAAWLARNLIVTRLTRSVQFEFDANLEELRGQLRASEERLKADLRVKEAEISSLRSGALTAMASRQVAVDARRLEAVDQLWSAVTELGKTKFIATMIGVVKFDKLAELAQRDPKVRELFTGLGAGFEMKKLDLAGAAKARPFVTPMVWATYTAISVVALHSVMKLEILKTGMKPEIILSDDLVGEVIKKVLPHYSDFIEKYGGMSFYMITDQLEAKLLQEIQAMLAGAESDKAAIEQAAEIMKLSSKVLAAEAIQPPELKAVVQKVGDAK